VAVGQEGKVSARGDPFAEPARPLKVEKYEDQIIPALRNKPPDEE